MRWKWSGGDDKGGGWNTSLVHLEVMLSDPRTGLGEPPPGTGLQAPRDEITLTATRYEMYPQNRVKMKPQNELGKDSSRWLSDAPHGNAERCRARRLTIGETHPRS